MLNALRLCAQVKVFNTSNANIKSTLTTKFANDDLFFNKGEIISNVLKIRNNSSGIVKFTVDLSVPDDWKTFNKSNKLYTLSSGDSIFIPVRIIPIELSKGSTKYMISAFISSDEGEQLGYSFFLAHTHKNISWIMDVLPDEHLYFKNNSNLLNFSVYLDNTGNEKQDIQLSLLNNSKFYIITDTAGKALKKSSNTLSLEAGKDTTIDFVMKNFVRDRNLKMIDFETYNPFLSEDMRKYTMYINSCIPGRSETSGFRVNKKIDFFKLPNNIRVNPYNSNVFPVDMDLNIYNLITGDPMVDMMLRGNTRLNNGASLSYFTQLSFSPDYVTNSTFKNIPFYLGYYQKRYSIEIGDIGYFGAKGIRTTFDISQNQKIEFHYSASPFFSTSHDRSDAGLRYNWRIKNFASLNVLYDHITYNDQFEKSYSDRVQSTFGFCLFKKHVISLSVGESRNYNLHNDTSKINYGYFLGFGYGSRFFKNHLYTNANISYASSNYQNYSYAYLNNNERISANLNNSYAFGKSSSLSMYNNYNRYAINALINGKSGYFNTNYTNQLTLMNSGSSGYNFSYLAFYNVIQSDTFSCNSRGLGFMTSRYNIENNRRNSISLKAGYTEAINYPPNPKNYFFAQFSFLSQYRTLSFQTMYNYGNAYVTRYLYSGVQNPNYQQYLRLSARYQYVFRNPRFVALPFLSFTYSNYTGENININPELDYFTRTGWRFKIVGDYFLAISKPQNYSSYYNYASEETTKANVSSNFSLQLGIHKNFGIPIPSKKNLYNTTKFIAFLDVNGNGKMDKEELPLENVVISVDGQQVITNSKGEAIIENMKVGNYSYKVLSLEDLQGWFPRKEDSIRMVNKNDVMYIPFSRGVKIFGNVTVERDPNSPAAKTPLDLSRIKISASDGKVYNTLTDNKGFYELFLPFGSYILSMDENILGEKFRLLQNNYQLQVSDSLNNLFIPFHIIEKKRRLNIKHNDGSNNNKTIIGNTSIKASDNNNVKPPANTTENNKAVNNTTATKEVKEYLEKLKKIDDVATTIVDKCKILSEEKDAKAKAITKNAESITNKRAKQKEINKADLLRLDMIQLYNKSESAKKIATLIEDEIAKQNNVKVDDNFVRENTNKLIYILLNKDNTDENIKIEDIKSVLDTNNNVILPDDTTVKKKR